MNLIILSVASCCVSLLLLIAVIYLLIIHRRQKKNNEKLIQSINDFMNSRTSVDISLYDNDFARLQNSVADLENLVLLLQGNIISENKKNMQFISDISHQLKTPIAALRLYCELDNELNPTSHSEKELLLIDNMEKLVYQLLRLEKIKTEAYVMEFKNNKAEDIVNRIVSDFQPLFPDKQFIVTGKSMLRCDEVWLGEAIANVIKNACEHTDKNGVIKIDISESQRSSSIEISDNGGGMPEAEIPNLFTRFYKAENSAPTSTGIGMSITKAIVEKHHGIISAANNKSGLTISICLPHIDGMETI
ncbi:MAG: HAMP domain-containing histidine kinase [Acetobacter sp.]|nr:HAMP domain-containing histidine kinase [Bacteroides sp.]MCM1341546.1 HAMP domain-containing histidine kinase [Acetobacter sp.]MCM1433623.1 HAMP domain-containing histidine kinase [Clostridiales bacterium]